ncbi:MAG: ExbD/TolR family protein [Bacillota bacterium]
MFKPSLSKKSSINILPLIDVIFFLLVFFMLFTSFRTTPEGLEMQLPTAETVTEQSQENIVVDISEDGQFYLEGEQLTVENLTDRIAELYEENSNRVTIINADQDTKYQHVITVMDSLRSEGFYDLALAAERDS